MLSIGHLCLLFAVKTFFVNIGLVELPVEVKILGNDLLDVAFEGSHTARHNFTLLRVLLAINLLAMSGYCVNLRKKIEVLVENCNSGVSSVCDAILVDIGRKTVECHKTSHQSLEKANWEAHIDHFGAIFPAPSLRDL
jgi:hypothetical protein